MAEKTPAIEVDSGLAEEARAFADKVLSGEVSTDPPAEEPAKAAEEPAVEEKPAKEVEKPAAEAKPTEDDDPESLAIVLRAKRNARRIEERATAAAQERVAAVERRAAELEQAQSKLLEGLKSDPIAALRDLGFTEEEIAQRLLGQPVATRKPDLVAQRLERLERELEAERVAKLQREKQAEEAQRNHALDSIKRGFVGHVASNDADYPHLVSFYEDNPQELADKAIAAADAYRAHTGRETSYKDVAAFLEEELARKYTVVQQRTTKPAVEQVAKKQGQRTLTPGDAAQRASVPKKAVEDMDEEERREEATRLAAEIVVRPRR